MNGQASFFAARVHQIETRIVDVMADGKRSIRSTLSTVK